MTTTRPTLLHLHKKKASPPLMLARCNAFIKNKFGRSVVCGQSMMRFLWSTVGYLRGFKNCYFIHSRLVTLYMYTIER